MKIYQLPKAFAEQWVKALRSGEYKQGPSMLYCPKDMAFCCLGVAEHILGALLRNLSGAGMPCNLNSPRVPDVLSDIDSALARKLAEMNDSGVSFVKIADWVEENVEFV